MKRFSLLTSLLLPLAVSSQQLAPLEQPDGRPIWFGPWFDRLHGDTVEAINARVGYKSMSLFQSDVNITNVLQADYMDDLVQQVTKTKTDAIVYLTVYPFEGFGNVSDAAINQLAEKVANVTKTGTRMFIRYASEMNGAWFQYGQQPTAFLASWRKVVGTIRAAAGTKNVAFVWAPNSGNGYPFPNYSHSAVPGTSNWDPLLDTNGNGRYDALDDPYSAFYPGDEWVDWVGMSAYHYGAEWYPQRGMNPSGWITNDVPEPNKISNILLGQGNWGHYNFYEMYCASAKQKPFMITETGATIHMAVRQIDGTWVAPARSDATSRVAIKQNWWRQMLNATFLKTFPKVKAISFFEFIKFEEESWRDFSSMGGDGNITSPLGNDGTAMDQEVLAAFKSDLNNGMADLLAWANPVPAPPVIKVASPVTATLLPKESPATAAIPQTIEKILSILCFWHTQNATGLATRLSSKATLEAVRMRLLLALSFLPLNCYSLAALELPNGSPVYFGPWLDRLHGDTVEAINARVGYKPMSLFQSDVNITNVLQADYMDDLVQQVVNSKTDAIVYLTVYPFDGFESVSDAAINQLAEKVANVTNSGTRMFIRYASEMNGAWFRYGQQPTAFLASWRKVVSAVRALAGTTNVAFVWAPNSGNGYPFPNYTYSAVPGTSNWDPLLDTNGNGRYDALDDPYTAFYPGDEWVDWVGMSTYHYGARWVPQRGKNPADVPEPNKISNIMVGARGWGNYNFYEMFCGSGRGGQPVSKSSGQKPFMMTETAATVHMAVQQTDGTWVAPAGSDSNSRVAIKQAWWRQMLNATFLETFPKVKAISFFEFIKFEEHSWRDFTTMGGYGNINSPLGNDGATFSGVLAAFQADLRNGVGNLLQWANPTQSQKTENTTVVNQTPSSNSGGFKSSAFQLLSLVLVSIVLK